jgi:hypothetical protein
MSEQADSLRRLKDLLSRAHEDLDTELKGWLNLSSEEHKANLAQAILALANYGGGFVLIGFTKKNGSWEPEEPRPPDLDSYSQDCINDIVQRYADPSFHCPVHHVTHSQSGLLYPIIIVPGHHRVPIRAKRSGPNGEHVHQNSYYTRRPGPKSETPQSGREWDELISRCIIAARDDLLDRIREILQGGLPATQSKGEERRELDEWIKRSMERFDSLVAEKLQNEKPSRYSKGFWYVAYSIKGVSSSMGLSEFLEVLKQVRGHETGWPPWWVPSREGITPYPYDGLVECWLTELRSGTFFGPARSDVFRDSGHSDFWRASPKGMMFLLRGYQEDSDTNIQPGTIVDVTLPIWRIGECLLHAERLANVIGDQATSVAFRAMWKGLSGRTLISWATPRRIFFDPRGPSRSDEVTSEITIPTDQISQTLAEIVKALTKPLYETFDFYDIPPTLVREELLKMRGIKS